MCGPAPLSVDLGFGSLRNIWLHQSSATELIPMKTGICFHPILLFSRVFLSSHLSVQCSIAPTLYDPFNLPRFRSVDVIQ